MGENYSRGLPRTYRSPRTGRWVSVRDRRETLAGVLQLSPARLEGETPRRPLRGVGSGYHNARKTRCPRGHWLLPGNLNPPQLQRRGWRQCWACMRARTRMQATGCTWDEAIAYVAGRWPEMAREARI